MVAPAWFGAVLSRYKRIAIVGGPRVGKSTLAARVTDRPVFSTDEFMGTPWDDVPGAVNAKADTQGASWVVEGVQVARALRKGLKPDVVVYLDGPAHEALSTGQEAMAKAVATVFDEWNAGNAKTPVIRRNK